MTSGVLAVYKQRYKRVNVEVNVSFSMKIFQAKIVLEKDFSVVKKKVLKVHIIICLWLQVRTYYYYY